MRLRGSGFADDRGLAGRYVEDGVFNYAIFLVTQGGYINTMEKLGAADDRGLVG